MLPSTKGGHKSLNPNKLLEQLDTIIQEHKEFQARSRFKDLSDLPLSDRQALVTRAVAAVHRIAGPTSRYAADIDRIVSMNPALHRHTSPIIGVVQALRDDLKAGYLETLIELVHSELFADFIEAAEYLNESGYKDPAAVVAASTLESHLRELCKKNNIAITEADRDGIVRPKKADMLNADLAKAGVYSKLDQKSVTAWLDLRNKAAHGKYAEYTKEQVALLISGIREFISRNPA